MTWFTSWERLFAVGVSAVALYIALIAMVRLSGKRTTSQMNNFDWVITVAIGGLIASGTLLDNVSVADALTGIGVLMALQWIITSLVIGSARFERMVKAQPTLLLSKGRLLKENMNKERISESEIRAALREHGMADLDEAGWVILETDASFSVIPPREGAQGGNLLGDVEGPRPGP